jgi:succinoglycan biosynthesis protein ExoM
MISVLIASMGRPHLTETLASIGRAHLPDGETLEIVIADDSPDGAVVGLIGSFQSALNITIVPVGAGNVSLARNACLEAARGDWLIFVDDDETVEPDWLVGHLSAAMDFNADAVFGPVFPIYPAGTPDWFIAANPLFGDWGWDNDGQSVPKGRTGNTLIRRAALKNLRFNPAFGRTGGEDDDFFLRFAAAGNNMVVTNRARAHEMVPEARANMTYALGRAFRTGQLYSQLRTRGKSLLHKLVFAGDAAAKAFICGLISLLSRPVDRARSLRMAMKARHNLGKISGLLRDQEDIAWQ